MTNKLLNEIKQEIIYRKNQQNYIFVLEFVGSHYKNKKWRCDFNRQEFTDYLSYLQRINNGVNFMEKEGMGILFNAYVLEQERN